MRSAYPAASYSDFLFAFLDTMAMDADAKYLKRKVKAGSAWFKNEPPRFALAALMWIIPPWLGYSRLTSDGSGPAASMFPARMLGPACARSSLNLDSCHLSPAYRWRQRSGHKSLA